jgi:hypothetical protein
MEGKLVLLSEDEKRMGTASQKSGGSLLSVPMRIRVNGSHIVEEFNPLDYPFCKL